MTETEARAACIEAGEDPDMMVMPGITMPQGYTKPIGPPRPWWTFKMPPEPVVPTPWEQAQSSAAAVVLGIITIEATPQLARDTASPAVVAPAQLGGA